MKKRTWILLAAFAVLVVIILLLLKACAPAPGILGNTDPQVTTENVTAGSTTAPDIDPTTGPTEAAGVTESPETEPITESTTDPTAPPDTEPETTPTSVPTDPTPTETKQTDPTPTESQPAECKHNYVSQITESPTCTASGIRTFVCYSCGSSYTESIAPYGHEYKTEVIAPTQTSQGYTLHTCSRCGESYKDSYTDPVPAETAPTGCQHEWQEVHHEEVGYTEWMGQCVCGFTFKDPDEWIAHTKSYSAVDAVLYHGSWHDHWEYIVDTPAYTEWVCSKCGEVSETEP